MSPDTLTARRQEPGARFSARGSGTPRLWLRRLRHDDVDLAAIFADAHVMRYYPRPKTKHETAAWIDWNLRLYADHGYGLWAAILKEDGKFIGDCGLTVQEVSGTQEVEVGYHIDRAHWKRGLANEGAAACRDYAVWTLGLQRLVAIIDPRNRASRRVAEKLGMRAEKRVLRGGRPQLVYAMRRE